MTSQAEQLRARISDLETEIDLQRKPPGKLEDDKILAQRQLNAVLDPVARLPFEISSEIFLQSLDAPFPEPGALHTPMLLLSICSAWTDIALVTPALWSTIGIIFPCPQSLKELVPIWLECAHNRPLSIFLSGAPFDQDVLSVIWGHGQQLHRLEMSQGDGGDTRDDIRRLWRGCSPGPLPSLQTLAIRGSGGGDYKFSFRQMSELLHMSPNLTECTLCHLYIIDDTEAKADIVLPKLRRLTLGEPGGLPFNNAILNCLSLPGLEVLSTSLPNQSACRDLLSFLKRSSPPLRELTVKFDESGIRNLPRYLLLVPDLRRLEVWWPECHVMEELFAVLAETPSLVPHLNTVFIHNPLSFSDSFWTALLRPLTARRTILQVIHLNVFSSRPASIMPAPDLAAAFGELAGDGSQVCVSTTCDLIWSYTFH